MRRYVFLACAVLLAMASRSHAQDRAAWLVTADFWGNPAYYTLTIDDAGGDAIDGIVDGDPFSGTRHGDRLAFTAKDRQDRPYHYEAVVTGDTMQGIAEMPDTNTPGARVRHSFTARRLPERPGEGPRRVAFVPRDYSNAFDPHRAPVLYLWPGDTLHTRTIDSGGVDASGNTVALFGNPQTGPFYVMGAEPGDTLVVHVERLSLDRDYADSLDAIVGRAQTLRLAGQAGALGRPVRWRLDRAAGVARPENAEGALAGYAVPLRPMLGGLGLAPGFGSQPMTTGDTGRTGGNMDFNAVVAGSTVYLPVEQPGALLYLGDAHAAQGDGETTQYALETSMDVTLRIELRKGPAIGMPRVEDDRRIMTLGQAGSLDEALRIATSGMVQWLGQDYGLDVSQAAQVLGSAVEYRVVNLAGRSVGLAAILDKALLPTPADAAPAR